MELQRAARSSRRTCGGSQLIGNRGVWLQSTSLNDLNAITPERLHAGASISTAPPIVRCFTAQIGSPNVQARGFRAPYAGVSPTQTLVQSLRPFPQFGNIPVRWSPLGNSWYDSLQVKVTKRYSHGLSTLQPASPGRKSSPLGADGGTINDVFNRRNQKNISPQSMPFVFVIAINYQSPASVRNRWFVRNGRMDIRRDPALPERTPDRRATAQNNLTPAFASAALWQSRTR